MTSRARKRSRKSELGEALIESFTEAVAWTRGEKKLPVREYRPPKAGRGRAIRLPDDLGALLTALAKHRKSTRIDVLRQAIESFARQTPGVTASVLAAGLIGSVADGPPDLATNPKHMEGFGRSSAESASSGARPSGDPPRRRRSAARKSKASRPRAPHRASARRARPP